MAITVGELIAIPYLGTRLHAGAAGLDRRVTWAHSCEVANPWNWLDEGDLLMTNGYSLPADAAGQVAFVRHLADAAISAVAIGEKQHAPPLRPEMAAEADVLGLPVLLTAYEVPFMALSRAVAGANDREEQARLTQTVRLYDRVREATVEGSDGAELLARLADDLRTELHLVDRRGCTEMLPGRPGPPAELVRALDDRLAPSPSQLPAMLRVPLGDGTAFAVPVPSRREALLVAVPRGASRPDLSVLQHVATIAALQVERLSAEREQRRRLGAELLSQLVEGRIEIASAQRQLASHGLAGQPLVLVADAGGGGAQAATLHDALIDAGVAHLLLRRGTVLISAIPNDDAALEVLRGTLGPDRALGISDPWEEPARAPDAVHEAIWAMEAAQADGVEMVRYGQGAPLFMPRTLSEAESVVRKVLGPVLDYDAAQGTELLRSLQVFLECNRSWQRAAAELFVHKQTLVYRMRRVEALTGRRLDDTAAVAELWLSLRACELGVGRKEGDAPARTSGREAPAISS